MTGNDVALVIGVDGQDGSYLAEHLISQGIETVGIGRRESPRIGADSPKFRYLSANAANAAELKEILDSVLPTRIYHLAATHGASGFFYEDVWQGALGCKSCQCAHLSRVHSQRTVEMSGLCMPVRSRRLVHPRLRQ